ncbi:unnamed protein product [Citrullus colocynthis]|uniref:rRNA N-glycosylase n=1 Tax=Citrullus colocynthis TaxID=252529 RepID=A0ABP0Y460_9ROSI
MFKNYINMELIESSSLNYSARAANHADRRPADSNLSFSLVGATASTYEQFIEDLRKALTLNSHSVYNIPVLASTAKGLNRFILLNLTNYQAESITLAVDVVDVYIVAYQAQNRAYFLKNVSKEAHDVLFKGMKHETLPYKGNYDDLERCAGKISRENIDLGLSELGCAIGNLFHYNPGNSVPKAFIVIIQTISEAARFKYIESKYNWDKFKPDPAFISLENRWSDLSEQIQKAEKQGGKFKAPVPVRNVKNEVIMVSDVNSPVVKGIALLLPDKLAEAKNGNLKQMEEVNQQGNFEIDF